MNPNYKPSLINYSKLMCKTDKVKEAIEVMEKYLQNFPNDNEIVNNLSLLYSQVNELEKAGKKYNNYLLDNNLPHPKSMYNYGVVLYQQNKLEEAVNHF